jgi:hypothetical protein
MRSFIAFAVLGLASADLTSYEIADCLVDGGEAVDDAADAALFIWAAYKRCGRSQMEVKCTVDIASATESVNSMINVMLKAMKKCHVLEASECGLAAGKLTRAVAGLTAGGADIIQKCPKAFHHTVPTAALPSFKTSQALCLVDVKDTAKQLMKITKEFMQVSKNCAKEDKHACASNALRIIGGLAAIGEFVSGSIGHCTKANATSGNHISALCAQAVSMVTHHTAKVAAASTDLSAKCVAPAPAPSPKSLNGGTVVIMEPGRLYEQGSKSRTTTSSLNIVLGAFLPVTAIVAFAGGRFYANRRIRTEQSRNLMHDTE